MANYTYEEHMAQVAARTANGENGPQIHFINEFLAKDGDVAIVRFPYRSMNDIVYTTVHTVPYPGTPYGRSVRCTGDMNCPLCARGEKKQDKVYLKFLVYTPNPAGGGVVVNNVVWERASAFADVDLKDLMEAAQEGYNTTLDNLLVKFKRTGSGQQTRYTASLTINNNREVYNPQIYVADFSDLEKMDAIKILSKSVEQYNEAINPSAKAANPAPAAQPTYQAPAYQAPAQNVYQAPAAPAYQAPAQQVVTPAVETPVNPTYGQMPYPQQTVAQEPQAGTYEQPVRQPNRVKF